jgi:hypothetical protein
MSRRRKPAPQAAPRSRPVVLFLLFVIAVLTAFLGRIYPEYQRLKAQPTGTAMRPLSPTRPSPPEPVTVVADLYFARLVEGQQRLIKARRELPPGLGVGRAAMEELLTGDVPAGCERPLPPGTKLRDINVTDGLATVDFNKELVQGFRGGSDNEGVTIYAIVNTLSSLPTVKRVRLLVDGQPISSIGGHLDTSGPLSYDGELVVK